MNKFWLLSVLILSSNCCATLTLIPTIDGDGSIWLDTGGNVVTGSPFILGVISPDSEPFSYYLFFEYEWMYQGEGIYFDMSQIDTGDSLNFGYDGGPTGMVVGGDFYGPGILFDNILVTGEGVINIYSGSSSPTYGEYLGTISVVPEPMSVFLLSAGFLLMRKRI